MARRPDSQPVWPNDTPNTVPPPSLEQWRRLQPPPRKKKRGTGLVLAIIAVTFLVLCGIAVIAAMGGGGDSGSNSGTAGGGAGNAKHAKVGEPARDGKFEFTVTGIKCRVAEVGTSGVAKTAQGQFCLITVTVKNIDSKPQTFDSSSQKAKGANGASYSSDPTAEVYANQGTETFLNEISPANQATGVMVFDIPKDATIASLELHDSPFSGGVTVDAS